MHFPHPSLGKHFFALSSSLLVWPPPWEKKEEDRQFITSGGTRGRLSPQLIQRLLIVFPHIAAAHILFSFWRHIFCLKVWGKELGVHFFLATIPLPILSPGKYPYRRAFPFPTFNRDLGKEMMEISFFLFFSGKTEEGAKKSYEREIKLMGPDLRPLVIRGIKKCIRILPLSPSKKVCVPLFRTFFQKKKNPFLLPPFLRERECMSRAEVWGGGGKVAMKERKRTSKNGKRERRKPRPTLQTNPLTNSHLFYDSILLEVKKNLSWDLSENEWLL